MRYSGQFLAIVRWIVQPISIDCHVIGIGQQRKVNFTTFIRGEFSGEFFTSLWRIDADRKQLHVLIFFQKRAQSGQLPGTVRSPVAAIEHKDYRILLLRIRKRNLPTLMVHESEVGSFFANCQWFRACLRTCRINYTDDDRASQH